MPDSFFKNSTNRLLLGLGVAILLGYITTFLWQRETQAPSPAPSPTPSLSGLPVSSAVPTESPLPTESPTPPPILETAYQTSGGLRYTDCDRYQKQLGQASTMAEASQALSDFLGQYGIGLWTTSDTLPATTQLNMTWSHLSPIDPTDLAHVKLFGSWFIDEWSKYPKAWLKLSGIENVALVNNLTSQGSNETGVASPIETVFYDVGFLNKIPTVTSGTEDYFRGIIQHEVSHEIGNQLQGGTNALDPTWSSFNPPGFTYGQIGTTVIHPLGFATNYGQTDIAEDKAEVYSYMFVDSRSKELADWIKTDPHLAGKVSDYKAFIKSQVPIMDDSYFSAINP